MRIFFLSIILIFIIISCVSAMENTDLEGQWAVYELTDEQPIPGLTRIRISFPSAEKVNNKEAIWFQFETFAGEERLFGTSRSFRDDGSGRIYGPRSDWSGLEEDYTYVPLTQEDYHKMIDAGMNIFRVPLDHLPWVIEKPVFFLIRSSFEKMPELLQPDYPVWETVPSAVWYEMEAGIAGWLIKGRYIPEWFSGLIKNELGVDFPDDIKSCIHFHHAFYTGAARHFKAKWGTTIYGQMDLETDTRFDFIFLRQGEKAEGYQEVRRILENSDVVIE